MQSSELRSKGAGRPSLLTPAQQAEADRNRILTKLEHGKANPGLGTRGRGRGLVWGSAGLLALILAGGAWYGMSGDPASTAVAPARLAANNVPPARPAVPPELPPAPAAATIQDEPPPAVSPMSSAVDAPALASAPGKPAAAETVKKHAAAKPAEKPVRMAAKAKPVAPRKADMHGETDTDVMILSALVAHTQPSHGLQRELDECNRLKGSKATECRAEACEGHEESISVCRKH